MQRDLMEQLSAVYGNVYFVVFLSFVCSVEIILRAEAVETAQAGDRCDFIGTLIVVPDVSSLSMPG